MTRSDIIYKSQWEKRPEKSKSLLVLGRKTRGDNSEIAL